MKLNLNCNTEFICPTLSFVKLKKNAIIPTKEKYNAGYDIYPLFDEKEFAIMPHETVKIPTGIASVIPENYYIQIQERSSTGKLGIKYSAGVVDSSYRGEWFLYVTNTNDIPVYISKEVDETVINTSYIKYPYKKALFQGILHSINNEISSREISLEEFKKYTSNRGDGLEGSSGK